MVTRLLLYSSNRVFSNGIDLIDTIKVADSKLMFRSKYSAVYEQIMTYNNSIFDDLRSALKVVIEMIDFCKEKIDNCRIIHLYLEMK